MSCCDDAYHVIDAAGFAFRLPCTLKPGHWLGPLHPTVHGFPLSRQQVRTDDYLRDAVPLVLEGTLRAATESELHEKAATIREWVRRAAWLQRRDEAVTRLLEGNDIELVPENNKSNVAKLRVVLVQAERLWYAPDGREITG